MELEFDGKISKRSCLTAIGIAILVIFTSLIPLVENGVVYAGTDTALNIAVSHAGKGEVEICFKNEGYNNVCDDFNLAQERDPVIMLVDVEDADVGDNFEVCYELMDADNEECNDFSFSGQNPQTVKLSIDSANVIPNTNSNELPELPPSTLPPLPPMS